MLQTSLTAARKSLAADCNPGHVGRVDMTLSCCYDSEGNGSIATRTPAGSKPVSSTAMHDVGGRENGSLNPVGNMVKEFEQQIQTFDDEAKSLVASNMNPEDELRRLKSRFETWKKDFKMRLRETKARLHKRVQAESDKARRKWWGKMGSRVLKHSS